MLGEWVSFFGVDFTLQVYRIDPSSEVDWPGVLSSREELTVSFMRAKCLLVVVSSLDLQNRTTNTEKPNVLGFFHFG